MDCSTPASWGKNRPSADSVSVPLMRTMARHAGSGADASAAIVSSNTHMKFADVAGQNMKMIQSQRLWRRGGDQLNRKEKFASQSGHWLVPVEVWHGRPERQSAFPRANPLFAAVFRDFHPWIPPEFSEIDGRLQQNHGLSRSRLRHVLRSVQNFRIRICGTGHGIHHES